MRKLFLLLFLLCAPSVFAQNTSGCFLPNASLTVYAFEQITVSTTSVPFTASVYTRTGQQPLVPAVLAIVSTETDNLRYRVDGIAPTSSVGHQLYAASTTSGSTVMVCGMQNIQKFRMIRSGSSDVTVTVSYYLVPTQ